MCRNVRFRRVRVNGSHHLLNKAGRAARAGRWNVLVLVVVVVVMVGLVLFWFYLELFSPPWSPTCPLSARAHKHTHAHAVITPAHEQLKREYKADLTL